MKRLVGWVVAAGAVLLLAAGKQMVVAGVAGGGPINPGASQYRVLEPIESGNLLLFPVVRGQGKSLGSTPFMTLDEGLKSGQVEVTEAGRVRGMYRPRPGHGPAPDLRPAGDQVNTLVLVNNSDKPLLLLAGEIVTGGKQDRVIAKDRIVPAGSDPIDLSVFCIEPGRWTGASDSFGATAKMPAESFMVQPTVREKAMVKKDQQEVWNSVGRSISQMAVAAAPTPTAGDVGFGHALNTTSYAKAMQESAVSAKVDEAAAPVMKSREQVLARLRQEGAIGVVVAVRGEIVWADLFADTDLLARYWTKLVRSYAAESLSAGEKRSAPTTADAQRFLDLPMEGRETSEGEVGVYRYMELNSGGEDEFILESLLPSAEYQVHVSRVKVKGEIRRPRPDVVY